MRKILATKDFVLGTFASNCSGGMTVTKLPERWGATWENNEKLAHLLDDAGIDFMLPIARWIGYGGETDFHGAVLETMTWAAGLLAKTKNITVFATMHVTANHPVVVAKQIATVDEISRGRAGLNIVAGWNKPEYDALGLELPTDHETRYRYAQEWFALVQKIWSTNGKFDWDGEFFKVKDCYGNPKPWRGERPPIINAAGSGEGRNFAVRNADFLFTPAIDLSRSKPEIGELKGNAKAARPVDRSADLLARRVPADREGGEELLAALRRHQRRLERGRQSHRAPIRQRPVVSARFVGADSRSYGCGPRRLSARRHARAGCRRHQPAA